MRKKIFVIDDDDDVREILVYTLRSEGYEVKEFSDARGALDELLRLPFQELPDLVMVDLLMPEMDGREFIHEVRVTHADKLGELKLALCSAMGPMEDEAIPEDVIRLHKPMELQELYETVQNICDQ